MLYEKVEISGFGCYEEKFSFEFPSGCSVITGDNGVGKSTIIDAVQWAIYGPTGSSRTLKDRRSIINSSSQTARVILTLNSDEYGHIEISRSLTRSPKHTLSLKVDGKKIKGGISVSQERINEVFSGLKSDTFNAISSMMSSPSVSVNRFITGSPTERREILSNIADPEQKYAQRNKQVVKELRLAKSERDKVIGEMNVITTLLEELQVVDKPVGSLSALEKKRDELAIEINSLVSHSGSAHSSLVRKRLEKEISELEEMKKEEEDRLSYVTSDISSLRKELLEITSDNEERLKKANVAKRKLDILDNEKKAAQYIIKSEANVVNFYLSRLDYIEQKASDEELISTVKTMSLEEGHCLVCGSDIDDEIEVHAHTDEVTQLRESISASEKKISVIESRIKELDSLRVELDRDSAYVDRSSECERIRERIVSKTEVARKIVEKCNDIIPGKIDDILFELKNLKEDDSDDNSEKINKLESSRDEVEEKIRVLEKHIREYDDYCSKLSSYSERKEAISKKLADRENTVATLEKEKFDTSPSGIIASDIAKIMSDVSNESSSVYRDIFGSSMDIELSHLVDEDSDKETCIISASGRDIATYSHGEQSRIIYSIIVGMSHAVTNHLGQSFPLMLDEPTTSMDKTYSDMLYEYISENSEEGQCIVITRDDVTDFDLDVFTV